jgi:hypothetical protein
MLQYEFNNDGGYVAHVADNLMPAPNRRWQVYRASVALMLLSAVAEAELKDANSIGSFYLAARAVNDDVNNLAGHVYPQTTWYPWQKSAATNGGTATFPDGTTTAQLATPFVPMISYRATGDNTTPKPENPATGTGFVPPPNYEDLFETDLPALYEHIFKAAAAAARQDRFVQAIQDATKGAGNPLSTAWIVAKDAFNLLGELVASEVSLAAAYRAETGNQAAIADSGTPGFPLDKAPVSPNCTSPIPASNTLLCAAQVTTQDAVTALTTHPVTQSIDVPANAFDPIYTAIRKSCQGLRAKLQKPATGASQVSMSANQSNVDCTFFIFAPYVYRGDYAATNTATP